MPVSKPVLWLQIMISVVVLGPRVDLTVFISEIYRYRCISAANMKNHSKSPPMLKFTADANIHRFCEFVISVQP